MKKKFWSVPAKCPSWSLYYKMRMRKRFKSGHVTSLRSDSVRLFQEKTCTRYFHIILYIFWKTHFIGLRVTFIIGIRVTVIMGAPCAQSSYCCLVWFVNIGVKFMRKAISDLDEFPKPLKSKVRILIGLIHHKDTTVTSRVMIILQLFIGEPPPPPFPFPPLMGEKCL